MAGAKLVGGQAAMFLSGTALRCRAGACDVRDRPPPRVEPLAGLVAAWLVMASPTYLFMLALPMIDVPVAALWTVAFLFLLRGNTVLVANGRRPHSRDLRALRTALRVVNALLAGLDPLTLAPLVRLVVPASGCCSTGAGRARRRVPTRRDADRAVLCAVASASVAIAMLFKHWYGSPLQSGYGGLDVLFAWSNIVPNLRNYFSWLVETQTIFALAGLLAVSCRCRASGRNAPIAGSSSIIGLFVAVLWAEYCIYLGFDAWWFLRFLLPAWPFMMLGLAALLLAVARRVAQFGFVVVTWLVVGSGRYTFDIGQARGAFTLRQSDRQYVAAAQLTRSMTPENSVVFTLLHSGSMRYYGGRMTMRFDLLDKEWLDRAVAWLAERGIASYVLLDGPEVDDFRARFAINSWFDGSTILPLFTIKGPPALELYALSSPAPAATAKPAIDCEGIALDASSGARRAYVFR